VQGAEIMIMKGAPEIFQRAKYIIQEVNVHKDKSFPTIPDEKEMDLYMKNIGFYDNEIIDKHDDVQIDKIYF
jgi:hypothetical protein